MFSIQDNFCGYVSIGDNTYVCTVVEHVVKLIPAYENIHDGYANLMRHISQYPEFIFGVDENNYSIALLRKDKFQHPLIFGTNVSFGTPLIVKSDGNMDGFYNLLPNGDWRNFDAITFSGGAINQIYNPKFAAMVSPTPEGTVEKYDDFDGAHTIRLKPFDEYTHSCSVEIDGEKADLIFSVSQDGKDGDYNVASLGNLISFVRLEFENPQEFDKIERYYNVVKSMLAIFAAQHNITFDVHLSQKDEDRGFQRTGLCKVYDNYEEYSERTHLQVLPLDYFGDYIPSLIEIICNNEANSLLAILPDDNKNLIHIEDIQNLCTALEVAYKQSEHKECKDELIGCLKKAIKKAIKDFSDGQPEIDINKQTTISSAFQYLDFTLKDKIIHLVPYYNVQLSLP